MSQAIEKFRNALRRLTDRATSSDKSLSEVSKTIDRNGYVDDWRKWTQQEQQVKASMFLHYAGSVRFVGSAYLRNPELVPLVKRAMSDDVFKLIPDSVTIINIDGLVFNRAVIVGRTPEAQAWDREDLVTYFKRRFGTGWSAPTKRE